MRFLPFQLPSDATAQFRNRVLAATGHRPEKCGGYSDAARERLTRIAVEWLTALEPRGAISGLAQGWDSAVIEACWALGLPYVTCAPFRGQESRWPLDARRRYERYVERSSKHIVCSPGGYAPARMQFRNEKMVDLALKEGPEHGLLLALWDGTGSGTRNCLDYAHLRGLPTINTWDDFQARLAA